MVKGVLTDPERILSHRQGARIRRAISRFVRQFPQLQFHAVLIPVASEISLAKYSFWVFNGATFCSDLHKGGLNFHNLLLIDVEHRRANLSVGYGLEPFVEESDLASILGKAEALLRAEAYGEAVLAILEAATATWHAKSSLIPQTFGLRLKDRSRE